MTLNISSVLRADGKIYRYFPSPGPGPNALYVVVECEPGRTDRQLCITNYADAVLITNALNNLGSKINYE